MEHKLIQGGEQYLPFARSRIKVLRASGLEFASQRFEMGDGSVEVRIAKGQDYITLTGGTALEMDSGVVSAPFSAGQSQQFLPGVLNETSYVAAYNAPFVGAPRRVNSAQGSAGQLSGRLKRANTFKGSVPQDRQTADSFAPKKVLNADTPPVLVDSVDDARVYEKKVLANSCPASVFTGKTRLYVQALYGKPLYRTVGGRLGALPQPAGPTSISIESYPRSGVTPVDVLITTASGVWLDPQTGGHWLFNVTDLAVFAYPLIGSAAAQRERKKLVSPTTLSAVDAEHLEAYILSTCLPDASAVQTIAKASIGSAYSMGYSWHWAWSTPKADIVINGSFWAGGYESNVGVESTHYRLELSPQHQAVNGVITATTFTIASTVVEGPARWTVKRSSWVIVEPDWGRGMVKSTSSGAQPQVCSGFFYAFYQRDQLKVCRIDVAKNTGTADERFSHPQFKPWLNLNWTRGTNRENAARLAPVQPFYYALTLSVGGETYADHRLGDVKEGGGWEVSITDTGAIAGYDSSYGGGFSSYQYQYGDPIGPDVSQSTWAESPLYYGPGLGGSAIGKEYAIFHVCEVTRETHTLRVENLGRIVAMVPAGDAEAIYIYSNKQVITTKSNRAVAVTQQYGFLENIAVIFRGGGRAGGTRGLWVPHDGGFPSLPNSALVTSVAEGITNQVMCSPGTLPSKFAPTDQFFLLFEDEIQGLYRSIASVKDVFICDGFADPNGVLGVPPPSPVIVGWT